MNIPTAAENTKRDNNQNYKVLKKKTVEIKSQKNNSKGKNKCKKVSKI